MYNYRVLSVVKVVDRTTVLCELDLGFGLTATVKLQLLGIDPPEIYESDVVDFICEWLDDRELIARTEKHRGTTVGDTWLAEFIDGRSGELLTTALIDSGFSS